MNNAARQRETLRQQQLLRALWQRGDAPGLNLWLRESGERAGHALAAYRGNARRSPSARWRRRFPPCSNCSATSRSRCWRGRCGTTHRRSGATWHAGATRCPAGSNATPQLADEPYLADVARVDWAVHTIEQAADVDPPAAGLALLAEHDPMALRLRLRPGLTLVSSRWPVVTIWQAHRRADADRFAPVRAALAAGTGRTRADRAQRLARAGRCARRWRCGIHGCAAARRVARTRRWTKPARPLRSTTGCGARSRRLGCRPSSACTSRARRLRADPRGGGPDRLHRFLPSWPSHA